VSGMFQNGSVCRMFVTIPSIKFCILCEKTSVYMCIISQIIVHDKTLNQREHGRTGTLHLKCGCMYYIVSSLTPTDQISN